MRITKSYLKTLSYAVNGAAIEVHRTLGPGLLESVYHKCLMHELNLRGINFVSEMEVPINYKGLSIASDLRCDLFIENILTIELKSVKQLLSINESQILSYMTLLKSPKGTIFNFNVSNLIKEGHHSYVNKLYKTLPEE